MLKEWRDVGGGTDLPLELLHPTVFTLHLSAALLTHKTLKALWFCSFDVDLLQIQSPTGVRREL